MAKGEPAQRKNPTLDLMPFPAKTARARLRNGLRVVTVSCPHLHGAAVALYVRAGSRFESMSTSGLSHFVEHMLFRGSAAYPSSWALNRAIEEHCGMLGGETGRDYSLYQVRCHPRALGQVLAILGDLFAAPLFSDIDLERAIVLEEILEDFDERGQRTNLDDVSRDHAWRGHPLGFPITGPERNIRRFTRADVVAHFRRHYGARNLVLAVASPLPGARVQALVEPAFARLPSGRRCQPRPAPAALAGPRFHVVRTDAAQVEVQILFHGLPERHPRYPALVLLLRLLDDGMATPLHYRVCDRRGLAYHVNAGLEPLGDTSLLEITAACAENKLPSLLDEIFTLLRELGDRPVDAGELAKAKRRYARDLEAGFDDVEGLCAWFGDSLLCERPLRTPAERYRRVVRVTAAQIQRAAREVLRRERLVVAAVGNVRAVVARRAHALVREFA